jgi:predicted amidohydrolase
MPALRLAAVQASYVLMDRDATIDRVAALTASAARDGAHLVVFPEAFVPGTPIWIDTQAIWEGDEEWFGLRRHEPGRTNLRTDRGLDEDGAIPQPGHPRPGRRRPT